MYDIEGGLVMVSWCAVGALRTPGRADIGQGRGLLLRLGRLGGVSRLVPNCHVTRVKIPGSRRAFRDERGFDGTSQGGLCVAFPPSDPGCCQFLRLVLAEVDLVRV